MEMFNVYAKENGLDCISDSAGMCAYGEPVSQNSKTALELLGINCDYKSKSVSEELLEQFDYVFGLTTSHADALKSAFPHFSDKIKSFPIQIQDPYGKDLNFYIDCRKQIYQGIETIIDFLKNADNVKVQTEFAKQSDAFDISQIEQQNFSCPWSQNAITEFLSYECNKILCVKKQNSVISYISFSVICDEIQISNVATHNDYKHKGYASNLICDLQKYAKRNNVKTIFLEVRQSNIAAINLYKKFMLKKIGIRKNFYTSPLEDALLFSYDVPQNEGN